MNLRQSIKAQARHAMQGCWGQARLILLTLLVLSSLISMLDSVIMGMLGYDFIFNSINSFSYSSNFFFELPAMAVSAMSWVVRLLLLTPLSVGMVGWYRQLTDRRKLGVSYIFSVYEGRAWLRSIWVAVTVGLRLLGLSALLLALPLFMIVQADYLAWSPLLAGVVGAGGLLLSLLAMLLLVVFAKRYSMTDMLLGECYNMTAGQAVRASVRYTKGHCFELFVVDLSFLPKLLPLIIFSTAWVMSTTVAYDPFSLMPLLLSCLTLLTWVITVFKVQPHYTMTRLMYCRYLYECGNSSVATHAAEITDDDAAPPAPAVKETRVRWSSLEEEPIPPAPQQPPATGVVWQDVE